MKKLAILGASGHGKVVAETASHSGWDEIYFFDDAWQKIKTNGPYAVVGDTESLLQSSEFEGAVVAIGDNQIRLMKTKQLQKVGFNLPFLVHPKSYVASDVVVEGGTVVFAGAMIQPGSKIGTAVVVNTGATVDHDCVLAEGVHISPGAHIAGGVSVGKHTWIGIGSSVNQYLSIGSNVTVGAGAAVVSNVGDGQTVVGVPARAENQKN